MKAFIALLIFALCAGAFPRDAQAEVHADAGATVKLQDLPPEAQDVLVRIRNGGPFAYKRDGVTFGNFEKRLPIRPRGYYREYTVPTPGARDRGARRIITGREGELFYTSDHYSTFRRIIE